MGFEVYALGFVVWGLRVWASGFRVQDVVLRASSEGLSRGLDILSNPPLRSLDLKPYVNPKPYISPVRSLDYCSFATLYGTLGCERLRRMVQGNTAVLLRV